MELKTKYQYTYFIYPFAIKETKYTRYLLKLLKDENCKLKIFRKDKDLDIYTYFTHRVRNYMFNTFNWNKTKLSKFECETYDVLYISVNETTNRYLQELYIDLCKIGYRQIEWYKAFQKYVPHITIAYLKKGTIDKYIKNYKFDFSNISFPLDIITIKRNSEPKKKAG